jgi:hypothetical protein
MLGACPIFPLSGDCQNGMTLIAEMDRTFQNAPPEVQAKFQSSHDSIMASASQYSWYTCYTEMSNAAVCNLGDQAYSVMGQIQTAMGQTPAPVLPGGPGTDYLNLILLGAALLIAVPLIIPMISARSR